MSLCGSRKNHKYFSLGWTSEGSCAAVFNCFREGAEQRALQQRPLQPQGLMALCPQCHGCHRAVFAAHRHWGVLLSLCQAWQSCKLLGASVAAAGLRGQAVPSCSSGINYSWQEIITGPVLYWCSYIVVTCGVSWFLLIGIRGEINVVVKVDLFNDLNRFRQSSCGVKFFCSK